MIPAYPPPYTESSMGRPLVESSWSCDPFGYGPTHSYLIQKAGLQQLVIQRVHYAIKKHLARHRALEFKWRQFFGMPCCLRLPSDGSSSTRNCAR